MHIVRKETSTTTKIRAVFDALAKTSTGISLNDILLVGPTVHPPLLDILIRSNLTVLHSSLISVACTELYNFLSLIRISIDLFGARILSLHSRIFEWCVSLSVYHHPHSLLICASSKMHWISQLNIQTLLKRLESLCRWLSDWIRLQQRSNYIAEGVARAIRKRWILVLRKWNSSEPAVMASIAPELKDAQSTLPISSLDNYTKILRLEWNSTSDQFQLTV